ncbi:MAG: diacylglycerol kinase family lipid kinase [Blastocatellia bacterium]|nr:diacylglycerol kinase family lipid kinase [Blastocatellia bacterium]
MKVKTKKSSLIYNPTAGALRRDPRQIDRLVSDLQLHGIEVTPLKTGSAGHATVLARQAVAEHAGIVIVCGGDGTINEAAQSLVGTETALAVWPCGTANVLAEELRLPRSTRALAQLIAEDNARTISVGRALKPESGWQRYFLLMAGIGLDASIVQGVDLNLKRLTGIGAYLASGLDYLARLPITPFSIESNGESYESTFAVIANAAHYAVWFTIAPEASMDDENLDLCLFNARSRLAYLKYAFLSMSGKHTRRSGVVYKTVREVRANSNDAALVQIDGDVVGNLPMQFEIVPHALRVIAPKF